jgi:hypothetical protein
MFYLDGSSEPTNALELSRALEAGLRKVLAFPVGASIVTIDGAYPAANLLQITLTGATVDPARKQPKPIGVGKTTPALSTKALRIIGNPVKIEAGRVQLDVSASDVSFVYDRNAAGQLLMLPASCRDGNASVEISLPDLEAMLLSQASMAAAQQGAKVTDIELRLDRRSECLLGVDVRVHAKKMMMGGVVHVTGQIDLDEQLNATVSRLTCEGEGVAGKIAATFIAPKLKRVEGQTFPIASFAYAGMRIRKLEIVSVDPVRIVAAFGG